MVIRTLVPATLLFTGCCYTPGTPLGKAAYAGDTPEVRRILASGYYDPDDIQQSLVAAARGGNATAVPVLLAHGASLEYRSGINNWTPLQHAIHRRKYDAVQAMLDAGADPNSGLHMAAGYGQTQTVAELLRRGADPSRVQSGRNALDVALTGVRDIDLWTRGKCQTDTIRELLKSSPQLRPARESVPDHCREIKTLMAGVRQ